VQSSTCQPDKRILVLSTIRPSDIPMNDGRLMADSPSHDLDLASTLAVRIHGHVNNRLHPTLGILVFRGFNLSFHGLQHLKLKVKSLKPAHFVSEKGPQILPIACSSAVRARVSWNPHVEAKMTEAR
jgi:hypothetical protein